MSRRIFLLSMLILTVILVARPGIKVPGDGTKQDLWYLTGDCAAMPEGFTAGYLMSGGTTTYARFGTVDDLTLSYAGAVLKKVYDAADETVYTGATDFADGADTAQEYTYDAMGNMTSDANRGITSILYNEIGLPYRITLSDGSKLYSVYDADGTLLRRGTFTVNGSSLGGFATAVFHNDDHYGCMTYTDGALSRIDTPNGYRTPEGTRYYVKDHQGNIRQVTDSVGTVLQDNHYYPYGMLMAESSDVIHTNRMSLDGGWLNRTANPYRYAGNELLTLRNMHLGDFHARVYDYATGRLLQPDPLREKYMGLPSYLYCAANPVNFIDKYGMDSVFFLKKGNIEFLVDDGKNTGQRYIVKGPQQKRIQKAIKKGEEVNLDYDSNDIQKLPSKEILSEVDKDMEKSETNGLEAGSHFNDDGTVVNWDLGTPPEEKGDGKKKQSISPFTINGKRKMGDVRRVEAYWHIHPAVDDGFGTAKVSKADKKWDESMRNSGYNGMTFVIGLRDGIISFYKNRKVLFKLKYNQLKNL